MGSEGETNYIERYWRDATPQDAIKEPPMVARFLEGKSDWFIGKLLGCWRDLHGDNPKWGTGNGLCYTTCQVYDAPEPGEGWRLVDVEKEQPQKGDEVFDFIIKKWQVRAHEKPYDKELIYRRLIEQPKPEPQYVPFVWEDREQLRGRPCDCSQDVPNTMLTRLEGQRQEFSGTSKEQRDTSNTSWWAVEPNVGRVAHGVASRVDRLRCIGNGQVPIVAATAWRRLIELSGRRVE